MELINHIAQVTDFYFPWAITMVLKGLSQLK